MGLPGCTTFGSDADVAVADNMTRHGDSKVREHIFTNFNISSSAGLSIAWSKGVPYIILLKIQPVSVFT